jgi:hypothetical protein
MANNVVITVQGGDQFYLLGAALEQAVREEIRSAFEDVIKTGEAIVRNEIREANASASGTLGQSVTSLINRLSLDNLNLSGDIVFSSPADRYVRYASDGRGAGKMPPLDRIRAWVAVKGLDSNLAYPIARQLGAKGTATDKWGRHGRRKFLDSAIRKIEIEAQRRFNQLPRQLETRLNTNVNSSRP